MQDEHCYYTISGIRNYWKIPALRGNQPEKTGYPTQKPLALYERMIRANSNEADMVPDPFAGCATTLVATERLRRKWVGIDLRDGAKNIVLDRLAKENLAGEGVDHTDFFDKDVHFTTESPGRTDYDDDAIPYLEPINRRIRHLEPWQKLSRNRIVEELTQAQSVIDGLVLCAGCGREMEAAFMELDHITPRSDRGVNDISNRILICSPCNTGKSNTLTLDDLYMENRKVGWMNNLAKAKQAGNLAERRCEKLRDE